MFFTTSGCIAIALGTLCYTTSPDRAEIFCSDKPMQGTFTCKEYDAILTAQIEAGKRSGCTSADGSTSTCMWMMSRPPR